MRANHKLAIALKEAGYDVPCSAYYYKNIEGTICYMQNDGLENYNSEEWGYYSAPTLHDITDWLREVKGVHVVVTVADKSAGWMFGIECVNGAFADMCSTVYPDHDTALTAAIEAALVILKNEGK